MNALSLSRADAGYVPLVAVRLLPNAAPIEFRTGRIAEFGTAIPGRNRKQSGTARGRISLPLNPQQLVDGRGEMDHPAGAWLQEPAHEITIFSENYDFSISLLLLEDGVKPPIFDDEEPEEDTYDRFMSTMRGRSGQQ